MKTHDVKHYCVLNQDVIELTLQLRCIKSLGQVIQGVTKQDQELAVVEHVHAHVSSW